MTTCRFPQIAAVLLVPVLILGACGSSEHEEAESAPRESQQQRETVPVHGTRVRLAPPPGFDVAQEFTGFAHPESGTSIVITEMEGPFEEFSSGFDEPEKLAREGMTVLEMEERPNGNHDGLLARITQTAGGFQVEKWVWVFGSKKASVMITGTCFDEAHLPVVREAILTASWDPTGTIGPQAGLGFELTTIGEFQLFQRISHTLLYTTDGKADTEQVGKPSFMIGPAMGSGLIGDKREFATRRLQQLPLRNARIEQVEEVEIDGLEGYEIVASAEHGLSGEGRVAYQVILFEPDNYWIAVGLCRTELGEEYLPRFRTMAGSLRRSRK